MWDYKRLASKYLKREEGIWDETPDKVRRLYRALAKIDAARLTIFLLCVEIGNKTEVARRLGVHRNTILRIYAAVTKEIENGLGRH